MALKFWCCDFLLCSNKGAKARHHVGSSCWNTNGKSFHMSLVIMTTYRTDRGNGKRSFYSGFKPTVHNNLSQKNGAFGKHSLNRTNSKWPMISAFLTFSDVTGGWTIGGVLMCLIFIQKSFRDDEMASLTSVMKRINLISDLRGRVRKACDCSFIHWHRASWCISVLCWICIGLKLT